MKKLICLVVAIIAMASVTVYSLNTSTTAQGPVDFLPPGTLALLDIKDATGQMDAFRASRLGRELAAIAIDETPDMSPDTREFGIILRRFAGFRNRVLDSPFVHEVLGSRAVVALLPPGPGSSGEPGPEARGSLPDSILRQTVILAHPRKNADLFPLLQFISPEIQALPETGYKGHTLYGVLVDEGRSFYYSPVDGYLVAGFSPMAVKACIDARLSRVSLSRSQDYAEVRSRLESDFHAFAFVNTAAVRGVLKEWLDRPEAHVTDQELQSPLAGVVDRIDGIQAAGTVVWQEKTGMIDSRSVALLQDPQPNPVIRKMIATSPSTVPLPGMAPVGSLAMYWENILDLKGIVESALTQGQQDELGRELESRTGLTLNQACRAIGSEMGVVVRQIHLGSLFPIPEFVVDIRVQDRGVVEAALEKAAASYLSGAGTGETLNTTSINGVDVHFIVLPFGRNLRPAYAFHDGLLILASNLDVMNSILTPGTATMAQDPAYVRTLTSPEMKANQFLFLDLGQLNDAASELLVQASGMMRLAGVETAEDFTVIMNSVAFPVLRGLSMMTHAATRSWSDNNVIYSETRICLETAVVK